MKNFNPFARDQPDHTGLSNHARTPVSSSILKKFQDPRVTFVHGKVDPTKVNYVVCTGRKNEFIYEGRCDRFINPDPACYSGDKAHLIVFLK